MRTWKWAVTAAATVTGLLVLGAQAIAGTPGSLSGNGDFVGGVTFSGPEPLVLWKLPGAGGRLGTCIDANVNGPLTGPYSLENTVDDPVFAELNHLYANASTSDVQLAELSALNSHKYDRVDTAAQWGYLARGQGGLSEADAQDMLARARSLAGPYTVSVSWPAADTAVGTAYTATLTVHAASGAPVPGATVSVTGTAVTLAAAQATTNSSGVATVGFRFPPGTTATGDITATVDEWLTVDRYRSSGEQTMLVTGAPSTAHGTHSGTIARTRDVTLIKIAEGDPARTPVAGYTFRITSAGGAVVVPALTTAGTPVDIGQLIPGQAYRATEISAPTGARLYIPKNPTTAFTVPEGTGGWTLAVADPAIPSPALHTEASPAHAVVGQRLSDTVTVAGNDGEDGTITAKVFGPAAVPPSGRCSDVTVEDYQSSPEQAFSVAIHGEAPGGSVTVLGPVVSQSGCYGWAESLVLSPSGATATSPPTAPQESSLVTAPAVGTVVSSQIASPGAALHDTVTVSGLGDQQATLVADLYGPLPANGANGCQGYSDAAWRAALAARGTALLRAHASSVITGDGVHVVAAATVTGLGCYTYVEELTPTSTGPRGAVQTAFGQPSESTIVIAPSVRTQASSTVVSPGAQVRDLVTVTGTAGVPATITGVLLGPVAPRLGSCAGLSWASAPVVGRLRPLDVDADGSYQTAPVRTSGAGCYTFVETLTPNGAARVQTTTPGVPAETVLAANATPLALTGAALASWLDVGAVLSVGGALLLLAGRRRKA